jgi:hypothetical protein
MPCNRHQVQDDPHGSPERGDVIVNDEVHQFVVELAHLVMRGVSRVLLSFATFTTSPGGGGRRPVLGLIQWRYYLGKLSCRRDPHLPALHCVDEIGQVMFFDVATPMPNP